MSWIYHERRCGLSSPDPTSLTLLALRVPQNETFADPGPTRIRCPLPAPRPVSCVISRILSTLARLHHPPALVVTLPLPGLTLTLLLSLAGLALRMDDQLSTPSSGCALDLRALPLVAQASSDRCVLSLSASASSSTSV
ncbi:hypothetical protein V8C44DRAFT_271107 [Trichoderma aethiopicum]